MALQSSSPPTSAFFTEKVFFYHAPLKAFSPLPVVNVRTGISSPFPNSAKIRKRDVAPWRGFQTSGLMRKNFLKGTLVRSKLKLRLF